MQPRLTVLTLGVDDLPRAVAFYRDGLGWPTAGIVGQEFAHGAVAFFELHPGLRLALWARYHEAFADLERAGVARRPVVPREAAHNAHGYFLRLADLDARTRFIQRLRDEGVHTVFHYVPLHDSPAGRKYGRASGTLAVTTSASERLVRLPLWLGLEEQQDYVIDRCRRALGR